MAALLRAPVSPALATGVIVAAEVGLAGGATVTVDLDAQWVAPAEPLQAAAGGVGPTTSSQPREILRLLLRDTHSLSWLTAQPGLGGRRDSSLPWHVRVLGRALEGAEM